MAEGRPHVLWQEIHEQPQSIRDTIAESSDDIIKLAKRLRGEDIRQVLLVARGASDNAASYARYLFGVVNGVLVTSVASSVFTLYEADIDISNTLVLGISQSGESTDVIDVLEMAGKRGALTAALTNTPDSPICRVAQMPLLTRAMREESVPATKTYTTALAVLHQLAAHWAQDTKMADAIQAVPELMHEVFELEPEIEDKSQRYRFLESCVVLARGLNFCTAQEIALKMADCALVLPSAFSAADFMHSAVGAIGPDVACILVAPIGDALSSMLELAMELDERNTEILTISNEPSLREVGAVSLQLPAPMPEHITPMVAIVAGQLLAYHIALHKGLNPDRPPGRRKVTRTW